MTETALTTWIAQRCELDPAAWERTSDLFASWRAWAEREGQRYGSTKEFRSGMEALGIKHRLQPGTKRAGYQGLRLTDFQGVGR